MSTAEDTYREVRALIEHGITHQPRSLQKRIGPSELGTSCTHCLCAKLAGWEKTEGDVPWLPTIGTAVHALFAEYVEQDTSGRWLSEKTVTVGQVAGEDITGSVDLFDTTTGTVLDFKVVGPSTLKKAKSGPSEVYRTQVALYGRGYENAGHTVNNVSIWYVPRNAVSLNNGIFWHEPYSRDLAEQALTRADHLARQVTALTAFPEALAAWIGALDRAEGCFDCARFPGGKHLPRPGHAPPADQLAGLLIPPAATAARATHAA